MALDYFKLPAPAKAEPPDSATGAGNARPAAIVADITMPAHARRAVRATLSWQAGRAQFSRTVRLSGAGGRSLPRLGWAAQPSQGNLGEQPPPQSKGCRGCLRVCASNGERSGLDDVDVGRRLLAAMSPRPDPTTVSLTLIVPHDSSPQQVCNVIVPLEKVSRSLMEWGKMG